FFQPGRAPLSSPGIPEQAELNVLPENWEHNVTFYEQMTRRIPVLEDIGIRLFFCGPESFTPDGVYHLGEVPGLGNYFVAAGFNSIGFLSGPGAGEVLADWIVDGRRPLDLVEADPRRSMRHEVNRRYLEERVTETLDVSYEIHWPFQQRERARGIRRSPLHNEVAAAGAVFGELGGWERANWYSPQPRSAGGAPGGGRLTFGRQAWFEAVGEEHEAVREHVALFDVSSFGKLLVTGRDALSLLQWVSANDVDVAPGRLVYTQWLNEWGGIEADVTVTRLESEEFLVLTAAACVVRDRDWLLRNRGDLNASVVDVSGGLAMASVMGPESRRLLEKLTDADISNDAFPFGCSREIDLGFGFVRATRITYVGELGFELLVPAEMATHIYEAIWAAGTEAGLRHAGYYALDSLRMEKAYRSFGHDIGPLDTPLEAGLGFAVAWDKGGAFLGRDKLASVREQGVTRRLVQFALDDPSATPYGDEPIYREGELVGKVASAAFGYTIGCPVALGYVEAGEPVDHSYFEAAPYEIEIACERFGARGSLTPLYDPKSERTRV
ncbi:MAG: GcvT family protein, partial [Acidimicrobiales bacterium]